MGLVRSGLIVVGVGFTLFCGTLFLGERRGADVVAAAESIRMRPSLWRDASERLDRYLGRVGAQEGCNDAYDSGLLTLELARLDLSETSDQAVRDRQRSQLESAEMRARHRLTCSPQDGQVWLYLAMLQSRLGTDDADIVRSLELSSWFAPHEAAVLKQRIRLATSLYARKVPGITDMLETDLLVFANQGRLSDLRDVMGEIGPTVAPILNTLPVSRDSSERMEILGRAASD